MKTGNYSTRVRRIIGDILLVMVTLLTADVVVVMLRKIGTVVLKTDYRSVFGYELIICMALLLFAFDVRFCIFTCMKFKAARIIGWILRITVIVFCVVIVFFCGKVAVGSMYKNAEKADYAIVLGMALENGEPTNDLLARLDSAQGYLEKYPEANLILTGGNADESGLTEAAVMWALLTERGVPEDRLIIEDQAKTTKENFENTVRMISADEPIVIISSNYHMDRAVKTARSAGFTHVMRLPAPSDFLTYGANMIWEVVLDLNELKV